MRAVSTLIIICFSTQLGYAQTSSSNEEFLKSICKETYIDLVPLKAKTPAIPSAFSEINVLDFRPDTSRIGICIEKKIQREILFHFSTSKTVRLFLDNSYSSASGSISLLVVLKKFWLSDIHDEDDDSKEGKLHCRINLRAETYIKDASGYIPFAVYDSTYRGERPIIITSNFRLPSLFDAFMEKIMSVDIDKALKKSRRLTYKEVLAYSNRDYVSPINKAQHELQKGVYASKNEFIDNSPSVTNYSIEKDESGLSALFLKDEDGKPYFSSKMWGYCDGKNSFVMMDGNLFPVFKNQHAYYVLGSKEYFVKRKMIPLFLLFPPALLAGGMMTVDENVSRKLRLFSLDLDTGQIY